MTTWKVFKQDDGEPAGYRVLGTVEADSYRPALKAAFLAWPKERGDFRGNCGFRLVRASVVAQVDAILHGRRH